MYAVPKLVVPLGVLSAGALVEVIGLRGALPVFSVGIAAIPVVVAFVPGVTHIEARTEPGA